MKTIFYFFLFSCISFKVFSQSDDCTTATLISPTSVCAVPVAGTSAGATQTMPGCTGNADDDVWYKFIATSNSFSLNVIPSSGYDAVLEVFSGSCGSLVSMDCIDASGSGNIESSYLYNLTPGNAYYFRVYNYAAGSGTSTFSVCLTSNPPPSNDDCVTAIAISSSSVCLSPVVGNSYYASQSFAGCVGNADDDVWYKFIATMTSHSLTVTGSTGYDAVLEAFSGNCTALTSLGCKDNTGAGGTEAIHLTGLTVGNTYFFRVHDYHTGWGTSTFSICLTDAPAPANDDCSAAIPLSVSSTSICLAPYAGTSLYGTESMTGCAGNADDDVWYKFVATANSHSIDVTPSNGYDAAVELFSGNCGSLVSMHCSDIAGSGGDEIIHIGGFTIGNTYYLRVYDYHLNSGTNTFTICITTPPILPPANDDCAGAFNLPVTPNCQPTYTVVSSSGATESQSSCAGYADDDIWFSFTAPTNQVAIHATGELVADAVIELFSGNCSSLNSIGCIDNTPAGQTETLIGSGLTVGQVYYFRVYEYHNTGGFTFTVNIDRMELNASASNSLICLGQSVSLTASGTPTYTWSNGVNNGASFTPTATATYTATGVGTGSCVNTATVTVNVSAPLTPSICMVTVDTLNVNNVIYWDKYNYDNLDSMIIYREVVANTYQRIGAVNKAAYSRFIDTVRHIGFRNGDPNIRSYRYKLQIKDTCGNYSALSAYHTSLFLNNTSGLFTWNFYDIESQSSPVVNYELYRDDNNTGAFNLIGTVTATLGVPSYTFTDVNFSTFAATARWGIIADGFSCYPSFKTDNASSPMQQVNKSKSNIKNNFTIPNPPADPDPQGIHEISLDSYIKLMPNPANDFLNIVSAFGIEKVNIYNSLGALVQINALNHETQSHIDVQGLSNGIYSVEILTQKGKIVKKLIIHK